MSNLKKVILFVSIIAVLVTSFMLPTFADETEYPLTDPYIDGYNGDVTVVTVDKVNVTTFPSISSSNTNNRKYIKKGSYFSAVGIIYKADGTTEIMKLIQYLNTNTTSSCISYGPYIVAGTKMTIDGVKLSAEGIRGVNSNNTITNLTLALYVNVKGGTVSLSNGTDRISVNYDDFVSAEMRYYTSLEDIDYEYTSGGMSGFNFSNWGVSFDYISYGNLTGYYNSGVTSGIQQGFQSGYDEGYQEGFASAGGSFADIVSNPEVGIGLPDISIDFANSPISHTLPNNLEKLTVLARFENVDGQILRLANDENLLTGNHSIVLDWLGNDVGDPPTFKGYRMVVYNSDGTVHGTLWYSIEALDDGSLVAADAWYWFPNYYMNGSLGVAPYRVHDIRIDAWVHGDSTAILESKPLTDDGFVITYPYMGEQFYTDGYDRGYGNGLKDGFDGADTSQAWMNLKDTIFVIFDAPFYVISQSFNFDLFGINIAGAIIAIISVAFIVFILKIIIVRLF